MWQDYPGLKSDLDDVEDYLRKNIISKNSLLTQAAFETIDAGGKRLRPAFVLLSAYFGKIDKKKLIPLASAVEILHTATLIHDDVLDDSAFRRNKETVYKKYGTDMAIYCGDFLYTKAVLMLSGVLTSDKLSIAARAIKTICEGEADQYRDKYTMNLSVPSYLKRISRKTAVLFSAACVLGALCSKCNHKLINTLGKFGFYYGMIFQMVDDIKDYRCDDINWGKPINNDLSKGILTLPAIYACKNDANIFSRVETYMNEKNMPTEEFSKLIADISSSGGIEHTKQFISRYANKALNQINALPSNDARDMLLKLLQELV